MLYHLMRKQFTKRFVSVLLTLTLGLSSASGAFSLVSAAEETEVFCNISFSKPAICCDVGEWIDLTQCAVQFSDHSTMTKSGIIWTYNDKTVSSFAPSARGVYPLMATVGSLSKTIYVVAKNPEETEYVLYRNDFDTMPTDFRVPENDGSISVSDSNFILDASGNKDSYIRVLLPAYLDVFGDATIKANMKITSPVDSKKWASLMYRVQNGDYPYYQSCLRSDATLANGVEISLKNESSEWEVYRESDFQYSNDSAYNLYAVTVKGTESVLAINGRETLEYGNTGYANGGFGLQTRGTKLMVDYVEVTLDGNDPVYKSADVSFSKPAIRADMGQTIDLTACDVQFTSNSIYTKGSNITWKKDGKVITSFMPTEAGVTLLTAASGKTTKKIYVVTRNLSDGEYVLYQNDFDTAPTNLRVSQYTGSSAYHDGAGHYILDASASANAYCRVFLPSFLDDFGDFKLETSYLESAAVDARKWSALMGLVQNQDYPYFQFCSRYDASVADGVDITEKNDPVQNVWNTLAKGSSTAKIIGAYNTYALVIHNNFISGYINGEKTLSVDEHSYVSGAMGLQARGLKLTVDYVKVTLGEDPEYRDTAVKCAVAKARPAIGCNAGQTILLDQCMVQFTYGAYPVDGSQITWKKDGQQITEFSDTSIGRHTLTATHGHTSMEVHIIAKSTTAREYELYSNDFTAGSTDYRIPEATNGGKVYPIDGTFVLNGSASADSYIRVLMPEFLDQFGDANLEASIKLTSPTDTSKWGAIMYRAQNANVPYMQCCLRYDSTPANGVEISERTSEGTWNVIEKASTTAHSSGGYNIIRVSTSARDTIFSINDTQVLTADNSPYFNGSWGFQVRGLTMTIDYVRVGFTSNYTPANIYTIPGGYVDVRNPSTGISVAPSLITDMKTMADFNNILSDCPAIAIMNYDVVDGIGKIVFSDGVATPDTALDKLGSKVIPAFRINDNADADSLAAFLQGRNQRDAFAVSKNLSVLDRAYSRWKYIRGVADYSDYTKFDPETIRYDALANSARVLILPETASKDAITQIQNSYSCVWLTISEGMTASVAATNKGPYGLITPDRAVTEHCFKTFYADNTLIRSTNVIGHRGNPSVAPENTILGAQTAYNNGANMVETDIYLTADNVVYIMHDETIDRTTNGSGKIQEKTSAELSQYKVDYFSGVAAQAIPTLEQYFQTIKGNPNQKLVIEMKHPPTTSLINGLSALIRKYDIMDQIVVISFIQNNLVSMSQNFPGIPVGWLNRLELDEANPVYSTYEVMENIQSYNCVCNPGYNNWGSAMIEELIHRGVTLWPWTINEQDQFDKLMIDGVGGITTDYSQWSKSYIKSIHWNSGSRVISSTYQDVLTDITNSCEVVVIEDTLGITHAAGNITVPQKKEGGKASFYYRYKSTTPTGISYYTVTEIRTIEVAPECTFELVSGSKLKLENSQLTNVTDVDTVAEVKAQFKHPVGIQDQGGNILADTDIVPTGAVVYLEADRKQNAVVILKGDVNGDGNVDTTDYLTIKSYFLKEMELTGIYYVAADCDGDGNITTTDYIRMKSHFLNEFDLYA